MKKQILLLFVVFLASSAIAFGQYLPNITIGTGATDPAAIECIAANEVECLSSDALNPLPGQPYTYQISIGSPTGWTGTYQWFVTQQSAAAASFITDGILTTDRDNQLMFAYGNNDFTVANTLNSEGYDDTAEGTNNITIIWNSFTYDEDNPVFVVIQVRGTDADGCTNDNLKVYKIQPKIAFTLDIANLASNGALQGASFGTCFSDIVGARYDPAFGTDGGVIYDYGINYLFFSVNAANYTDSWRPSIKVEGTDAIQDVSVHWAYPANATSAAAAGWNEMPLDGDGNYTSTNPVEAQDASNAVGSDGECIIVRVTIEHNHFEGIDDLPITVSVDGKTRLDLPLADQIADVHYTGGDNICGEPDDFDYDIVTHTLQQRPEMIDETDPDPDDDFLPIAPEP